MDLFGCWLYYRGMKYARRHPLRMFLSAAAAVFLAMVQAAPVTAMPVDGLYVQDVVVANQSQAERQRAYREALEQVVLKVTGQQRFVENSNVRSALSSAADYVEEVSYRTELVPVPVPQGDSPASPFTPTTQQQGVLQVRFARDQVDDMLLRSGIPIWDRNRPSVLVWLTLQDESGRRTMLGSGSDHPVMAAMDSFSRQRAVPFLVPILDLTDRRALTADQAWGLDESAIREASARYGADSVLAGRIMETGSGDIVSLWRFIFRDESETFDHFDDDFQTFMHMPLDRVTVRLAEHFALPPGALSGRQQLTVRVDGVRDIQTHVSLLRYLQDLALVHSAHVSLLAGDRVELTVNVSGGASRLSEFISLDRDLAPVNFSLGDVSDSSSLLHYRWTR